MAKWLRAGKTVSEEGTTIEYQLMETWESITVESRRRNIPHANGIGTWPHTSYYVLKNDEEVGQYYSLRSAQQHAEEMLKT